MSLKIGDRIKDNDSRMTYRRALVIEGFEGSRVVAYEILASGTRLGPYKIQMKRIHTDGKPRKSGFTLLEG